jgi:DNA repair protein RecN (Recombination protein N)
VTRLLELRVRGLGILRDARWECADGFGVVSGETGAGKSLCVSALRWVLGGRIDGDAVTDRTAVSAVFEPDAGSADLLGALGIAAEELLTVSREAGSSGRCTCRANGSLISQTTLRELGERLAEVTAQGASHRLLRRAWQRRLLDDSGGAALAAARRETARAHRSWSLAEAALGEARAASGRSAASLVEAEAVVAELEPLRLRAGEEEELSAERGRLHHATALARAALLLADAAGGEEQAASEVVSRALAQLTTLHGVDPELDRLRAAATTLVRELRDLATAARRHADRIELDPTRLEVVEERLHALARVRRRHGSVAAALDDLSRARHLLEAAPGSENLRTLEAAAGEARARAASAARRLSELRHGAARRLERAVEARLASLEMPHARFRVILSSVPDPTGVDAGNGPVRCDSEGIDQVELRFASTRDGVPLPLDEGASGGELSRIALALAAAGSAEGQPPLILDEVDIGIGGETAARVGDLLAAIGRHRQVVAVTHRPEIAARAGWHLLVSRRDSPTQAASRVERVEGGPRVAEVARMMSGRTTRAALVRASELLDEGGARSVTGGRRAG